MTNTRKLKSVMIENGVTSKELAKQIGITSTTFSYKVNNRREFGIREVGKIKEFLNLSSDEIFAIFFANDVDLKATKEFYKS